MSNSPQQNFDNLQAIIDAKIAMIQSIVTLLAQLIASPSPTYNIDGQMVSIESYQKMLTDQQMAEVKSVQELIKTQNQIMPYQLQSRCI